MSRQRLSDGRDEHVSRTAPAQREQQFLRSRNQIEECASRKIFACEFEGKPAGIILRSNVRKQQREI